MLRDAPNLDTIDIDVIYSVPFRPQKRFLNPQLKITFFGDFWTLNFRVFFVWKNQRLNIFTDLKISFFITPLHVLSTPNTICPYLKKIFWSKNIWYFGFLKSQKNTKFCIFWDFRNPKYQIFLDQNIFLRYGHMVLGVLRTCKEVMKNEILRSKKLFKRWFFKPKKLRKFRVQKSPKNVILSCGFKKRFWGTEYMTSISIVSTFGASRNIVNFLILWSSRHF